jgi:anti-sigma B factor antagonist
MQNLVIGLESVNDSVDLIKVSGNLDAHTFETFDEALNDLFSRRRYRLIVDMTDVEYVSSAGVGVFIAAVNEAESNGGRVVLVNPSASVRETLDVLGLAETFVVAPDLQGALAAL